MDKNKYWLTLIFQTEKTPEKKTEKDYIIEDVSSKMPLFSTRSYTETFLNTMIVFSNFYLPCSYYETIKKHLHFTIIYKVCF